MFEEMLAELNTQIRSMILENVKDFISLEGKLPETLNRKEVAKLIGVSVNSFDEYYRYEPDFPKEDKARRWNKFEVVEYFKKGKGTT